MMKKIYIYVVQHKLSTIYEKDRQIDKTQKSILGTWSSNVGSRNIID